MDAFNAWQVANGELVTVQVDGGYEEVVPHGRGLTAYEMADGTYVAFMTIHGDYPMATPLVVLR